MTSLTAKRYRLLSKIGAGGMGEVYRAYDRLTGDVVALKRVLLPTQALSFASRTTNASVEALQLSLAREFRALASLRHPNIISVLDYGFIPQDDDADDALPPDPPDEQMTRLLSPLGTLDESPPALPVRGRRAQPFFTMDFLPDADPFDRATRRLPLITVLELVTQMLQALAYLHRHGILHRDLKPGNVLVTRREDGTRSLHLVDFGLSGTVGVSGSLSGTIFYIAPEALENKPLSEATDLYAVGVMLYEVLTGYHPFAGSASLINDIRTREPDIAPLLDKPEVRAVPGVATMIQRLLAKQPADRYRDAHELIDELRTLLGLPPMPESETVRESFLQAAKFVGRDAELATLSAALDDALHGKGSVWLVGGESGVGKSRLLEELRTRAMVSGAIVLRGQGVAGGGLPYQLWREPMRQVALIYAPADDQAAPLTPELLAEARIFMQIVPDIEQLVRQPVQPLPAIDSQSSMQRLSGAVVSALRRVGAPILIIFEDVHWADESLTLLKLLLPALARMSIMVVTSYRDDERPDLPAELPAARLLKLARLNDDAIASLSTAMLGGYTIPADLLALLRRETEGNAFFLVETMRALAQQAGRLSDVLRSALPNQVLAGGVQAVIRRRLERAPQSARPLLMRAAVAGRQLDVHVIAQALGMNTNAKRATLDRLLAATAEAAVLEVNDGKWRFAHDKLRETLLMDMPADDKQAIHREIALAIEAVYPNDDDQAAVLARHWREAGDTEKERHYAFRAGKQAEATSQFRMAQEFFERAAALLPPDAIESWDVRYNLARVMRTLNNLPDALARLLALVDEAILRHDETRELFAKYELIYTYDLLGQRDEIDRLLAQTMPRLHLLGQRPERALFYGRAGYHAIMRGNLDEAEELFSRGQALAEEMGYAHEALLILQNAASVHYHRGDIDRALATIDQLIAKLDTTTQLTHLSDAYGNRGLFLWGQKRYAEALVWLEKSLEIDMRIGKVTNETITLITMGYCYLGLHNNEMAEVYLRAALRGAVQIAAIPLMLDALSGLASMWAEAGDPERAAEVYGLAISHPATDADLHYTVTPLIDALRPHIDAAALDAALARGKNMDLDALVAAVLDA